MTIEVVTIKNNSNINESTNGNNRNGNNNDNDSYRPCCREMNFVNFYYENCVASSKREKYTNKNNNINSTRNEHKIKTGNNYINNNNKNVQNHNGANNGIVTNSLSASWVSINHAHDT